MPAVGVHNRVSGGLEMVESHAVELVVFVCRTFYKDVGLPSEMLGRAGR